MRIRRRSSTESASDKHTQCRPFTRSTSTLATPVLWQILIMIPPHGGKLDDVMGPHRTVAPQAGQVGG
jgi:hypothetical protein